MKPIDQENQQHSKPKELWTVRLLLLSVVSTVLIIIMVTLGGELSIRHRSVMTTVPFLLVCAFLSSLVGFVIGINERTKNKRQALFGITGNFVLLILYVTVLMLIFEIFPNIPTR